MFYVTGEELYTGESSLINTAYHEAGHAILARLTGRPIDAIGLSREGKAASGFIANGHEISHAFEIIRNNDSVLTRSKRLPDVSEGLRKQLAMRRCCVSLAGLGAEILLNGINLAGQATLVRDDNDHIKARAVMRDAFGFDHLHYAQLTTIFYLRRCWNEVRVTANALLMQCAGNERALLRKCNLQHAPYFSREFAHAKWVDEDWH